MLVGKEAISMKCYICDSDKSTVIKHGVRDNASINVLKCNACGFVYLDGHGHLCESFYEQNGMEESDDSSVVFETPSEMDTERRFGQYKQQLYGKNVLDFGCADGAFLHRLKREGTCKKLYALEPNHKYVETLRADFSYCSDIDDIPESSIDVITLFHVLEHIPDPLPILTQLYSKLTDGGIIILEVPNADDALVKSYDCQSFIDFTYWSCHLYLFTAATLDNLLSKTAYKVDYIKQVQRYSLANHLHWLSVGKPGGHVLWEHLDEPLLQSQYEKKLAEIGQCDTLVAKLSK